MKKQLRKTILVALGTAALCAITMNGACHDDTGPIELEDVLYEGGASDEALESLIAAKLVTDASQAAIFDAPMSGATLPATPAPTFSWKVGGMAANDVRPSTGEPGAAVAFLHRSFDEVAPRALTNFLFGGSRSAYAHGEPLSGPGYLLVFSTASNDKLLRVFTSKTTYTPDDAALTRLTEAGDTIHAVVTHAEFEENRIATDGGPFAGTEITFTLQ